MGLLRSHGFILLWLGQFAGTLADWALRTLLLVWVFTLTRSGVAVSLVGLAEAAPLLALSPVAGVFVDRWSRSYTMTGAVLARAVLLLPLLAVNSRSGLPLLLLVTVLINGASQFFVPAASAAVPSVVGRDQVGVANSLLAFINGGVSVIGPAAAGLLFGAMGPHRAVVLLGALYLAAAPLLAMVPAPRPDDAGSERASVVSEMVNGLRYVRRSRLLLSLIGVAFVALLGVGALSVLDVVFVTRALHLRSESVGLLLSSHGVGEALGSVGILLFSAWAARRYHLLLGLSVISSGFCLVVYALAPSLPVAAAALALDGASFALILTSFMTLVQLESDDAYMGRVMSLINTGMAVAMILSMAIGGVLADLVGVRRVIGAGAALLIGAGLLTLLVVRATPAPRRGDEQSSETDMRAVAL